VRVRFLRLAQAELREAVRYYESRAPSLVADFLVEITAALDRIADFPAAWPQVDKELRQYRVARFPYGVVYADEGDEILIVAVTHLHRRPESWRTRLREKK